MTRAEFLRLLRTNRGLTQQELATQAGISVNTLGTMEQNRNDDRALRRSNSLALLRALFEADPLDPGEIERFRDDFDLAARDVEQAIGPLMRADAATGETEWARSIRTSIAQIAAHIGEEPTHDLLGNLAAVVQLAAAQTGLDSEKDIARKLAAFSTRRRLEGLAATESAGRRITVRQPPEDGPVPGSTVERLEHYTVDEATGEMRRLVELAGRRTDISDEELAKAVRSISRRTKHTPDADPHPDRSTDTPTGSE